MATAYLRAVSHYSLTAMSEENEINQQKVGKQGENWEIRKYFKKTKESEKMETIHRDKRS
jgi:hypothetical protein